jgi:hypothetical protein
VNRIPQNKIPVKPALWITCKKIGRRNAGAGTIPMITLSGSARATMAEPTRGLMPDRRELYRSPNGDAWFLGREPGDGRAFIIHQPNAPSGGRLSHIELGEFLRSGDGPEQRALLRLIGTLVEVPPFT